MLWFCLMWFYLDMYDVLYMNLDDVLTRCSSMICIVFVFFFHAEDGIRGAQESRGLGDVYKRQGLAKTLAERPEVKIIDYTGGPTFGAWLESYGAQHLSLIHI
mgnify:CR=1 FL=1